MGGGDDKRRGGDGGGREKKKARYMQHSKGPAAVDKSIPLGSVGVMITCDSNLEDRAATQAVALIEEAYDKLKPAATAAAEGSSEGQVKPSGGKDISALIAEEVAQIKDKAQQKFRVWGTGVKGCTFVAFPSNAGGPGPVEVVQHIAREAKETKQLRAKNCSRFLPFTNVCFSSVEDIKAMVPGVITAAFPAGDDVTPLTFAVEYEHRSADKLDRMTVINLFAEAVPKPHKVNLTAPDKTIIVQVSRNRCGVSVVEGYKDLLKFNLRQLTMSEEELAAQAALHKSRGQQAAAAPAKETAAAAGTATEEAEGNAEDKAEDKTVDKAEEKAEDKVEDKAEDKADEKADEVGK